MNLVIENKENLNLDYFCELLINDIRLNLASSIENKKLIQFDNYLNNLNIQFRYGQKRYLSSKEILIASTYNLQVLQRNQEYIIEINPNILIPNTNLSYLNIVKLINYGNLLLNPYPIYDKIMNDIALRLPELYNDYILGV